MSFVFLSGMSYNPAYFINCDKEDLETCCVKLLTQPQSFQTETLAILLCYLPYLFSALMSQTGFFPTVSDPWKIHATTHSSKPDRWSCGWPKRDSQGSRPSSFGNANFSPEGAEEQYEGYNKILEQSSLFLGLSSPLFQDNLGGHDGRTPPGIEIFILEH